jgi:hypothetical protein
VLSALNVIAHSGASARRLNPFYGCLRSCRDADPYYICMITAHACYVQQNKDDDTISPATGVGPTLEPSRSSRKEVEVFFNKMSVFRDRHLM